MTLCALGACPSTQAPRQTGDAAAPADDQTEEPAAKDAAVAPTPGNRVPDAAAPDVRVSIDERPTMTDPGATRPDAAAVPPEDAPAADAAKAADTAVAKDTRTMGPNGELVWIDKEYSFKGDPTLAITGGFKNGDPVENWYKPLNYHDGTIQVRVTVRKNDPPIPEWLEVVFNANNAGNSPHTCLQCIAKPADLEILGDHTCSASPKGGAGWGCYPTSAIDWSKPFGPFQIQVGGTDNSGNRVYVKAPAGHILNVHYTAVLVPAGVKFSGWSNYPVPAL